MNRWISVITWASCLLAALMMLISCQVKIFGLEPTLDEAVAKLSKGLGAQLTMTKAKEKYRKFDHWHSPPGPVSLEAIGPAKGPAYYNLTVPADDHTLSRLLVLLEVLAPEWSDRKAWLGGALRQLEAGTDPKGRIRMKPSTNRVVVMSVDKATRRASLAIMTLVWEDYQQAAGPVAGPKAN